MTTMVEATELTDAEARAAARAALAEGGYSFAELAEQHSRNSFESLDARLTWEAVRHAGDPS